MEQLSPEDGGIRWLILRGLGGVYLVAFLSLAVQIEGLIGSAGIAPVASYLPSAWEQLGWEAVRRIPTLAWLWHSDWALRCYAYAGALGGLMALVGWAIVPALSACWVLYLSLTAAGQIFLSYQWDMLLLEAGLLGLFLPFTRWGLWAGRWLLFRLLFYSGYFKWASGDPTWADWTALSHHWETQPLPTPLAWYVHPLPMWVDQAGVLFMYLAEIVAPLLLFTPRRVRRWAAPPIAGLQIAIMLTGNYTFFNVLTLVLTLFALDDRLLERAGWAGVVHRGRRWIRQRERRPHLRRAATVAVGAILLLSGLQFAREMDAPTPDAAESALSYVRPFRVTNTYGLFVNMTTERPEVIVQGRHAGGEWRTYGLRYKPDGPSEAPPWVAPHQPRLDWQMWFAALRGSYQQAPWTTRLARALLEGRDPVEELLGTNPFPKEPPDEVRMLLRDFSFTSWNNEPGNRWWRTSKPEVFLPAVGLEDFRRSPTR